MLTQFKDKALMVLAILLAMTLVSWLLLYAAMLDAKTTGAVLLLLAFVKVQLIISQYMELHKAIVPVRIAFWLWTTATAALCISMYLP